MLTNVGIIPLRLYNLSIFTNSNGLSITPIQFPFTNILDVFPKYSGLHSNINSIEV